MNRIILIIFFCFCVAKLSFGQENFIGGKYSKEKLKELLIPQSKWTPFPRLEDRASWEKADSTMMKTYLARAEDYLDYEWPYIPATKSLLIVRNGNRSEYEAIHFRKRHVLGTLLLAEIHENKGRFVDQIINGVWSICEESWWGVPAHLPEGLAGLADVADPFIDLFAAETATSLAWTDYFLGEKLDAVSPQIRKRIYFEVNKRIFESGMQKSHWWMGEKYGGRLPNNWNPWICSNWLNAALLLEKNDDRRAEMVYKITDVLDQYVNPYPEDGGCDEGPHYWGAAPASLFDNLAMLNDASDGAFAYVFENTKIRNMAKFIYRAQISEDYFLNFADASPKLRIDPALVYRFGKAIGDEKMMSFAAYYYTEKAGGYVHSHFFRNFYELFLQDELSKVSKDLPLPQNVWLPDLQVMVARDKEGISDGFFIAAKGGHNGESHNHNDVGNFIVYYNGLPLLIDVGSGTYTKRTFSDQRYEIWSNCSDFHNLPTINGKDQLHGSKFKANEVEYQSSNSRVQFSMDISQAYHVEAGVNSWKRTIQLKRNKQVELVDAFDLKSPSNVIEHFMTVYPSEVVNPGSLIIHYQDDESEIKDFVLHYDPMKLRPQIEKIKLQTEEDQGVLKKWGDRIYRISFQSIEPQKKSAFKFVIREY